jgi:hypothetical protein
MPFFEHTGFELEHEQQDDPGSCVDSGRECLDQVCGIDPVNELQAGG